MQFERICPDSSLVGTSGLFWFKVKSVTLVENATALFPDYMIERGQRQLGMLVRAIEQGNCAADISCNPTI